MSYLEGNSQLRKNVVFVGGAAREMLIFRARLIQLLSSCGHTVYVFCFDFSEADKLAVCRIGAVPMDYTGGRVSLNPLKNISHFSFLLSSIRRLRPDVIFAFFAKPIIYAGLIGRLLRIQRIVVMIEGLGYPFTPDPRKTFDLKKLVIRSILVLSYRLVFRFSHQVIFLNHDDPSDLKRYFSIPQDKIFVLGPIGVDLSQYKFSAPSLGSDVSFVFVGRLLIDKGVRDYFQAAKIVRKHRPNVKFYLVGGLDLENPNGISREELASYIESGIVEYVGYTKNVAEWIARSHVFVLPSFYREGFPRSTQEAMAIGRPVITTNVPGCRDSVVDGQDGFIVNPWDASELAEKMHYFIDNRDEIGRMGVNAHVKAKSLFDDSPINKKLSMLILGP